MRVGIIAFLQESNTFLAERTEYWHFASNLLAVGADVREALGKTHHEVAGFFEGLDALGLEAVPIFATRALPFGTITAESFRRLMDEMFENVERAGRLDGYLLAPHGATVSEEYPDADGYWMSRLRSLVGPGVPLISTADPHANLSPAMVESSDAIIAYRSNPHLDQKSRGVEAARLLGGTLRGEVRPVQAASFPPMLMNIDCQHTTAEPCLSVVRRVDELRAREDILAASLFLGFPYADVPEMGASALVVTDNRLDLARQYAAELGGELWSRRESLAGQLVSVEEALIRADGMEGPICLLDMGDNVGGGSPGDGTVIAHALAKGCHGPAFICLYDPEAVKKAEAAGIGGRVSIAVGGKTDDRHGPPLKINGVVAGIADGKFEEAEPRHGGYTQFDQGLTAIVRTDPDLTIMLTSRRMVPFSLGQLTTFGVNPREYRLLVAKGVNAPLAAYEPVCPNFIRVNTPGVTTADVHQLTYHHRRRPMYPFEPETRFDPPAN
jgi:microcystin degradation protein MlrC